MRDQLTPPADDPELVTLVTAAAEAVDDGALPEEAAAGLRRAGWEVEADRLVDLCGLDHEILDLARELVAATRYPELSALDLSRDELIAVVRRLTPTDPAYDEDNEAWWATVFESQVAYPGPLSLIYFPPADAPDPWDAPAVVDHARRYRPIEL